MQTGEMSYFSIDLRDRQVQISGEIAILTGIAHMNIQINGMPRIANIRYTTPWCKQENTWQMLVFATIKLKCNVGTELRRELDWSALDVAIKQRLI